MAVNVKGYIKTLTASQKDITIVERTVPTGFKWVLLETGYYLAQTGSIKVYVKEKLVDELPKEVAADHNHRVVRNIEMLAGDTIKATATEIAAVGGIFGIVLVYDEVKA